MGSSKMSLLMVIMAVASVMMSSAEAQEEKNCAAKLVPCASYVNSTKPPASCCNPVKEAMTNDRACLCNLYNTPGFLESVGLNFDKALRLGRACGVDADANMCKVSASPPSSSMSPPGVAGGDSNSAGRLSWTGIAAAILVSAVAMLH